MTSLEPDQVYTEGPALGLRQALDDFPELDLCLHDAYQDGTFGPSGRPTNIVILTTIILSPAHFIFASYLAMTFSIDVIGFTVMGATDEESFLVPPDHPCFKLQVPRLAGPGHEFIPEPTFTTHPDAFSLASYHINNPLIDCHVDIFGGPDCPGHSVILCPLPTNPAVTHTLRISTPSTAHPTPRSYPPIVVPRINRVCRVPAEDILAWSPRTPPRLVESPPAAVQCALETAQPSVQIPPTPLDAISESETDPIAMTPVAPTQATAQTGVPDSPGAPLASPSGTSLSRPVSALRATAKPWYPRLLRAWRSPRRDWTPKAHPRPLRTTFSAAFYSLSRIAYADLKHRSHALHLHHTPLVAPACFSPVASLVLPAISPRPATRRLKQPIAANRSRTVIRRRTSAPCHIRALFFFSHPLIAVVFLFHLLAHWAPMFDQAISLPGPLAPAIASNLHATFSDYPVTPPLSACYIMTDSFPHHSYCVWPPPSVPAECHPIFLVLQYDTDMGGGLYLGMKGHLVPQMACFSQFSWMFRTMFNLPSPPRTGVG